MPDVTVESLQAWHTSRNDGLDTVADEADDYGDIEDDLGYYPDGVKRTLTDEQIAIFRHSEVQTLLRERRHQQEHYDEGRDVNQSTSIIQHNKTSGNKREHSAWNGPNMSTGTGRKRRKKNRKPRPPKGEGEKARQANAAEAKLMEHHRARMLGSLGGTAQRDEDYTPRRAARELDEVRHADVEVDYG